MKISVGDKVRFLNEVGGGTVSRVEGDKLIYVLDEDGFEVPSLVNEVVLVAKKEGGDSNAQATDTNVLANGTYEFVESDEEGEPGLWLACTRDDNLTGNVKFYLINDSNFFAFYTIGRVNKGKISNAYRGSIEPNTKVLLDTMAINFVDGVEYVSQLLLYRISKEYTPFEPVVERFKLAGTKLLKDNSYLFNEYLEDRAVMIPLIKGTFEKKLEQLTNKDIERVLVQKEQKPKEKNHIKGDEKDILEVDLHIHELLDDTRGLSNKDMLEYQLGKFHEIMNENKNKKNRKLVFIHGKGNGVLKSEIIKALSKKYSWHSYQDASFKEYGYGATMVII